jgi:hypothetical protein
MRTKKNLQQSWHKQLPQPAFHQSSEELARPMQKGNQVDERQERQVSRPRSKVA